MQLFFFVHMQEPPPPTKYEHRVKETQKHKINSYKTSIYKLYNYKKTITKED